MFSVNVDKLVKMTVKEAEDYSHTIDTIISKLVQEKNINVSRGMKTSIGIVGDGISAFKLASEFTNLGKNVLFIDGELSSDIFLGKYRLGKELEGLADCIMSAITGEALSKKICVTNNEKLNILFSGNIESSGTTVSGVFSAGERYIPTFMKELFQKYDVIVCLSDEKGNIAKYCDATAIVIDSEEYNNKQHVKEQITQLKNNGCNVMGVIINE